MNYKIFKTVKTGKARYYVQYQTSDGTWETIEELDSSNHIFDEYTTRYFKTIKKAKEFMTQFIERKNLRETPDVVVYEEEAC